MNSGFVKIFAGSEAMESLKESGFSPELFRTFLAASGGPKCFSLFGLDRFLFGEFFKSRTTELNLLGSSSGAFRVACFAQKQPVAALERFASKYMQTCYTERPSPREVSTKVELILRYLFGDNGEQELLDNRIFKSHFFVARSKGLVASEASLAQCMGLLESLVRNLFSRKSLGKQYVRTIFHSPNSTLNLNDADSIPSEMVSLNRENILASLLASGSLPLTMQSVKDILGAQAGAYRDGGLVDYHFDLKINSPGLTLYPHFAHRPLAGWFDNYSGRTAKASNYSNVVLVCPSLEFVQSLPYCKIPDKSDFTKMDNESRIKYWLTVKQESERVADDFHKCLHQGEIERVINPLPF